MKQIAHFFDEEGRIKALPAKHSAKLQVLEVLAEKFEDKRIYTEREVNETATRLPTFGDFYLLRRELIDAELLTRTSNCAKYRRTAKTSGNIAAKV